jgi:hypothetical protein
MNQEELQAAETAFVEGFRQVSDKLGFLRLARIPLEIEGVGEPSLKLMQVAVEEVFEVGRASPGFGSRELVYHPLPGKLVTSKTRLSFHYVSSTTAREFALAELLTLSDVEKAGDAPSRHHEHNHHGHHHHGKDYADNSAITPAVARR